jgi:hypothetical protein
MRISIIPTNRVSLFGLRESSRFLRFRSAAAGVPEHITELIEEITTGIQTKSLLHVAALGGMITEHSSEIEAQKNNADTCNPHPS